MAAGTAEYNYTNGSAALNMYAFPGNAVPQEETYEAPQTTASEEAYLHERRRERYRTHEAAIARANEKQAVSIVAVVGFGIVALLMVFVILSYVRLTVITAEISSLNSEITELTGTSKKLAVEYETTFNLNEVKEYATAYLGMKQMTEADVTRFTMSREDRGVVLNKDDAAGFGIIDAARDFISSLTEYLR